MAGATVGDDARRPRGTCRNDAPLSELRRPIAPAGWPDPMIRLATDADATAIAAIYRPAVEERATSFELTAPDSAEMARRVTITTRRFPWLVFDTGDTVAGYAHAGAHRERAAYQWSVEVSAYVRPDAQRRGIARALYGSLFSILTLQGFRNVYAGITLPNAASVGFHTVMGFTSVGVYRRVGYKHGAWHDVAWFERTLREADPDSEPDPPRPLSETQSSDDLALTLSIAQTPDKRGRQSR
jgi:phosphinothricin acetyltransferase